MKVRYLNLPPELLAAVSAMYSRSNLGIDGILRELGIDGQTPVVEHSTTQIAEKTKQRIMSCAVDYGHRSITGLTGGLAVFMDDVSMYLVCELFSFCQTGAGQETSTRFAAFDKSGTPPPELISARWSVSDWSEYEQFLSSGYDLYKRLYAYWDNLAVEHPELMRIPQEQLDAAAAGDTKAKKVVDRIKRNFAFDRARYPLPVSTKTNVVLNVSAQGWIDLLAWLNSHYLPEFIELGKRITEELRPVIPLLLRHVDHDPQIHALLLDEGVNLAHHAEAGGQLHVWNDDDAVELQVPYIYSTSRWGSSSLSHRQHRYHPVGTAWRRMVVDFKIRNLAMAELRDLNRHRPGFRVASYVPVGVYCAGDQAPEHTDLIQEAEQYLLKSAQRALSMLAEGDPAFMYWTNLGTQYHWHHILPAHQFIYLSELRTGMGVHFRYCAQVRALLKQWYRLFPGTRGVILEGDAEPE